VPKEEALRLDAQDVPVRAIAAYERYLAESPRDLDAYINLAVLYFECSDPGFAAAHEIPHAVLAASTEKAEALLNTAEERFGWRAEIEFWRKYVRFVALGDPPFYERAVELATAGESLVPYLHLAGHGPYQEEARALLNAVASGRSTKDRYIRSVLESSALYDWFEDAE
jgi:hypothetical protein